MCMESGMKERLAAAVAESGAVDEDGVLANPSEVMPMCGAVRLARRAGLSLRELFGDAA
jgi:hypothetical protein